MKQPVTDSASRLEQYELDKYKEGIRKDLAKGYGLDGMPRGVAGMSPMEALRRELENLKAEYASIKAGYENVRQENRALRAETEKMRDMLRAFAQWSIGPDYKERLEELKNARNDE